MFYLQSCFPVWSSQDKLLWINADKANKLHGVACVSVSQTQYLSHSGYVNQASHFMYLFITYLTIQHYNYMLSIKQLDD